MPCNTVKTPIATTIVCSGRRPMPRCSAPRCSTRGTRLCDYSTPTGSCDKPLCVEHSRQVARGVDHCLDHPEAQVTLAVAERKPLPQAGRPRGRDVEEISDSRLNT